MIQKKAREKERKSERGKGKKNTEKAQREKVRLMAWVSNDRDTPFQFFEKVLTHFNVSTET